MITRFLAILTATALHAAAFTLHEPNLPPPLDLDPDQLKTWMVREVIADGSRLAEKGVSVRVLLSVGTVNTVPTSYPDESIRDVWHLYPAQNLPPKEHFSVVISPELEAKFQKAGITRIREHFQGRWLVIEGRLSITTLSLPGAPTVPFYEIILNDFEQFTVSKASLETEP